MLLWDIGCIYEFFLGRQVKSSRKSGKRGGEEKEEKKCEQIYRTCVGFIIKKININYSDNTIFDYYGVTKSICITVKFLIYNYISKCEFNKKKKDEFKEKF